VHRLTCSEFWFVYRRPLGIVYHENATCQVCALRRFIFFVRTFFCGADSRRDNFLRGKPAMSVLGVVSGGLLFCHHVLECANVPSFATPEAMEHLPMRTDSERRRFFFVEGA
jgi:hypothetical protein